MIKRVCCSDGLDESISVPLSLSFVCGFLPDQAQDLSSLVELEPSWVCDESLAETKNVFLWILVGLKGPLLFKFHVYGIR